MKTTIKLEKYGTYLTSRELADRIFENIEAIEEKEIVIDFQNIKRVSRSFANQYRKNKQTTHKKLLDKHVSEEVKLMLDVSTEEKKKERFDFSNYKIKSY